MTDPPIVSRPYHAKMACPACVWNRGEHAEWCSRHPDKLPVITAIDHEAGTVTIGTPTRYSYCDLDDDQLAALNDVLAAQPPQLTQTYFPVKVPRGLLEQIQRGKLIEE